MEVSLNRFKQLSSRDVELVAKLSERIHYTNSNESFFNHAFVVLKEAVPNTGFSVENYSIVPFTFEQGVHGEISDELVSVCRKYLHQHPLMKTFLPLRRSMISTILTVTSSAEFHKTDLYQKYYKIQGTEDQLVLFLPYPTGFYVVVYSRDTAFSEKEKAILELLKPQVYIALINWQHIRRLEMHQRTLEEKNVVIDIEPADDSKHLMDRLSPRQQAVAEQVSRGLENREIAEVLHISPKTVGKHLENIFETLDIHHRTALASMWLQSGDSEKRATARTLRQ